MPGTNKKTPVLFQKISLILLLIVILLIFKTSLGKFTTHADNNISIVIIKPGSPFYPIKLISEKAMIAASFSNTSKSKLLKTLFMRRYAELNYVATNKRIDLMENISNKFSYQAGVLAEHMVLMHYTDEPNKVKNIFINCLLVLPTLRDYYPANSSNWLFIQQNIDTINILLLKI